MSKVTSQGAVWREFRIGFRKGAVWIFVSAAINNWVVADYPGLFGLEHVSMVRALVWMVGVGIAIGMMDAWKRRP